MPLYEYQCEKCGRRFEVIQKFSDEPLSECAECGGKVERLLSAPAIQFKGSGWYITDYARQSNGDKESKSAAGESKETAKEPKAESKSEKPAKESKPASDKSGGKSAE